MSLNSLNDIEQSAARNSASESENPATGGGGLLAPSGNEAKTHSFHSYYQVKREPSHRYVVSLSLG